MQILRMLLAPCVVLGFAGPAFSQQPAEPEPRGYVAVFSGIELETSASTDVMFAAEYAEHVGPGAQAYVTFTYFENLMSADLEDEIAKLGSALSATTGAPWEFRGRDRGASLIAGAKAVGSRGSTFRPYVGAGAGVLNLRRTISESRIGNVTTAVFNDYGVGGASLADTSETVPLVEILAGVGYTVGRHTYVDVGYRFRRVFRLDDGLNLSQISVGIGYRF